MAKIGRQRLVSIWKESLKDSMEILGVKNLTETNVNVVVGIASDLVEKKIGWQND